MTRERRRYTRVQLELPANLYLFQADVHQAGTVVDLSMGGCYFPVREEVDNGAECKIRLSIGDGFERRELEISGRVVRKDEGGIGIEFIDLFKTDLCLLESIMDTYR